MLSIRLRLGLPSGLFLSGFPIHVPPVIIIIIIIITITIIIITITIIIPTTEEKEEECSGICYVGT
jgi:hypothetical protein